MLEEKNCAQRRVDGPSTGVDIKFHIISLYFISVEHWTVDWFDWFIDFFVVLEHPVVKFRILCRCQLFMHISPSHIKQKKNRNQKDCNRNISLFRFCKFVFVSLVSSWMQIYIFYIIFLCWTLSIVPFIFFDVVKSNWKDKNKSFKSVSCDRGTLKFNWMRNNLICHVISLDGCLIWTNSKTVEKQRFWMNTDFRVCVLLV